MSSKRKKVKAKKATSTLSTSSTSSTLSTSSTTTSTVEPQSTSSIVVSSSSSLSSSSPISERSMDVSKKIFSRYSALIDDLNNAFGDGRPHLKRYNIYMEAIDQNKSTDIDFILEQVKIIEKFCLSNKDAILKMDRKLLPVLKYNSERSINFPDIFGNSDPTQKGCIWRHLLTILNCFDKIDNLKEILDDITPEKFMTDDIFDKINDINESMTEDDDNPMNLFSAVMNSGLMGSLTSGKVGDINTGGLIKQLKKMINNISLDDEEDEKKNGKTSDEKKLEKQVEKDIEKERKIQNKIRKETEKAIETQSKLLIDEVD